jgi:hypothetical protein
MADQQATDLRTYESGNGAIADSTTVVYCQEITLQALSTNAADVEIRNTSYSSTSGMPLAAGESITLPITDPRRVYVVATGTDKVRVSLAFRPSVS